MDYYQYNWSSSCEISQVLRCQSSLMQLCYSAVQPYGPRLRISQRLLQRRQYKARQYRELDDEI